MDTERYNQVIARADRVMQRIDERGGPAQAAARRERQRLNSDLGHRLKRIGIGIGLVSIATIVVGLVTPIGMFGFLAAVGLAIGIAAMVAFLPSQVRSVEILEDYINKTDNLACKIYSFSGCRFKHAASIPVTTPVKEVGDSARGEGEWKKSRRPCFQFQKQGKCDRKDCPLVHSEASNTRGW